MASGTSRADPWERLAGLSADILAPVLEEESVEVGAVMLSKLSTAKAAELLGKLPGDKARRIAYAVSLTGNVAPETVHRIGQALAAQRHDEKQIAAMESILAEGTRMATSDDQAALLEMNQRFHDALGSIAANSVLQELMRSLRDRTALIFAPLNRTRGQQNWDEHAAILRAVIKGDAELASLLAMRHVYNAAQMEP